MASTVSTRLTLQDGMSGTLQKISKNIGGVVDGFQRVQNGAAGVASGSKLIFDLKPFVAAIKIG
ncbi:MAG: hypothetical protein IJH61_00710 [Eubacteriaceae bacterium]|nr:hypothetical protein [Eubacteriaceae bacterium]